MKCSYGCGNDGIFKLKNGKLCCSKNTASCPSIREKNSNGVKKARIDGKMHSFTIDDVRKSNEGSLQHAIKDTFRKNSFRSNTFVKRILIEHMGWKEECSVCGISEWLGKKLSIELDHVNGINSDCDIDNLRFLCPNCHSMTINFRGRNINNGSKKVSDGDIIEAIKHSKNIRRALIRVGLSPKGANYERVENIMAKNSIVFGIT